MTLTPEDVQANLDELKTQIPTLEEQLLSTVIACWNNVSYLNYDFTATLMVAPMAMKILSVSLSWEYYNQAANGTDFWRLRLQKGTNSNGFNTIATRSTEPSGQFSNGGIVARKAWTFDAAAWADASMAKDDLLQMAFSRLGAPADMRLPLTATIRYAAL